MEFSLVEPLFPVRSKLSCREIRKPFSANDRCRRTFHIHRLALFFLIACLRKRSAEHGGEADCTRVKSAKNKRMATGLRSEIERDLMSRSKDTYCWGSNFHTANLVGMSVFPPIWV